MGKVWQIILFLRYSSSSLYIFLLASCSSSRIILISSATLLSNPVKIDSDPPAIAAIGITYLLSASAVPVKSHGNSADAAANRSWKASYPPYEQVFRFQILVQKI